MFTDIENLKINNIHKGISKRQSCVTCRKSNSFVLRTKGTVRYTFSNHIIDVYPGEIIFLPKGSSYDFSTLTNADGEYIAITFDGVLADAKPAAYLLEGFQDAEEFKNNMTDLWKFGGRAEHYRCYSVFYNLLSYIENLEKQTYINKNKFDIILPAVSYLKSHIYDCDLKIDKLYQLCGISGTYFRIIFQSNFGASPQKYILGKRLSHAKTIIDSGDFGNVSEIAASVGYADPLYFSRAFKKKYGISPSKYAKN